MKRIQILGPAGDSASELTMAVVRHLNEQGIAYRIERILDEEEIMSHGVIVTPALVVDGRVSTTGVLPDDGEIGELLR